MLTGTAVMDYTDTSALTILADAAIARAEAEMAMAVREGATAPREDDDAEVAEAAAILTRMRKANITTSKAGAPSGSTQASSGFAIVAGSENEESCWSKAARKNRDKGHKTWQTFNILRPVRMLRLASPSRRHRSRRRRSPAGSKLRRWPAG